MVPQSLSALLLLASVIARTTAVRNCWYPDGNTETADTPCDPNAEESACCAADAFCMSNGLCMRAGVLSRGSCTDRNWDSPACATQCTDVNRSGGAPVRSCNATLGTWVCSGNGGDCEDDSIVFPIPGEELNRIVIRPQNEEDSPLTLDPSSSINNATDSGNGSSIITTVTVSPSSSASAGYTAGQMAGVGAGVGVPLLLALFGAIFVILRQRKRLHASPPTHAGHELQPSQHSAQYSASPLVPYEAYAPETKVHSAAPYYQSDSSGRVVQMAEVDGEQGRVEMDGGK